jgi:hypothetical protein
LALALDSDLMNHEQGWEAPLISIMILVGMRMTIRFVSGHSQHALGFSWYDMNLKGNKTIDDNSQVDDTIFLANGTMQSKVDLTMYRLFTTGPFIAVIKLN